MPHRGALAESDLAAVISPVSGGLAVYPDPR
jgi:hypothetical protein